MAPLRHPPPPTEQQQAAAAAAAAAAAVRLPDFHADSLQSWFTNLDSQFATANITQSLTKFHWAVAKLPFSLSPTIQPRVDAHLYSRTNSNTRNIGNSKKDSNSRYASSSRDASNIKEPATAGTPTISGP
jgi:hypothetical protein